MTYMLTMNKQTNVHVSIFKLESVASGNKHSMKCIFPKLIDPVWAVPPCLLSSLLHHEVKLWENYPKVLLYGPGAMP